jgi:hypothetical protein
MVLVSERVHPCSLDFWNQRRVVLLRESRKLPWAKIRLKVKNLMDKHPSEKMCARVYKRFSIKVGHVPYKYGNCGRKAILTPALKKWLVGRMLALRTKTICTSTLLQEQLAKKKEKKAKEEKKEKKKVKNNKHKNSAVIKV